MKTINKPLEGLTENVTERDIPKEVVSAVPMNAQQMIEVLSLANPKAKVVLPVEEQALSIVKLSLDDDKVYLGLGADINKPSMKQQFLDAIEGLIYNTTIPVAQKYLRVWTSNSDMEETELIMNPAKNLRAKYNYYKIAYDDNLHLIANTDVFIAEYAVGNGTTDEIIKVVE